MGEQTQNRFTEKCITVSQILLWLFFFDLSLTGSGHYLAWGGLTPRLVLGFALLVLALPLFWQEGKALLRDPYVWLFAAFALYAVWKAVEGRLRGNNSSVWSSDIKGFMWMFLIPVFRILIRNRMDMRRVINAVLCGATCQAVFSIFWNIFFAAMSAELLPALRQRLWDMMWGTMLSCEFNTVRVFCRGSIYLIPACAFALHRALQREKIHWGYMAVFVVNAEAVLLTYTRSVYLGTALAFVLTTLVLLRYYPIRRCLLRILLALTLFLSVNYGMELVLRQGNLQYAFARCLHVDLDRYLPLPHTWTQQEVDYEEITENTNATREMTLNGLWTLIRRNPLFGNGFGATSPERDMQDEYFYLDVLARAGILGMLLYLGPLLYAIYEILYLRRERLKTWCEGFLIPAALSAYLLASYFNPWMNAVLGIAWYALFCTVPAIAVREQDI